MAKKKKAPPPLPKKKSAEPPAEEGLPLWMATFADMVTLLLCFFVLLLSFAQQDVSKFKTLMGSIRDAFGVQIKREDAPFAAFSPTAYERKEVKLDENNQAVLGMVMELKQIVINDPKLKDAAKIAAEQDGVIMRIPNSVLFDPGSATLKTDTNESLGHVINVLKEYNFQLVIRGNTDDDPVTGSAYPSAWELSSSRAAACLRYLLEHSELSASRIKAVGYASSRPLVPNNSDANRALNSRMEFFFHKATGDSW